MDLNPQEPPKPTVEIIRRFDKTVETFCKDFDVSKLIALQMTTDEHLSSVDSLHTQLQELSVRLSSLEQKIKEITEQKEEIFSQQKLISRALGKTDPKEVRFDPQDRIIPSAQENPPISVTRNQSRISFKLVATSFVSALAWWLWIYTHQK